MTGSMLSRSFGGQIRDTPGAPPPAALALDDVLAADPVEPAPATFAPAMEDGGEPGRDALPLDEITLPGVVVAINCVPLIVAAFELPKVVA